MWEDREKYVVMRKGGARGEVGGGWRDGQAGRSWDRRRGQRILLEWPRTGGRGGTRRVHVCAAALGKVG